MPYRFTYCLSFLSPFFNVWMFPSNKCAMFISLCDYSSPLLSHPSPCLSFKGVSEIGKHMMADTASAFRLVLPVINGWSEANIPLNFIYWHWSFTCALDLPKMKPHFGFSVLTLNIIAGERDVWQVSLTTQVNCLFMGISLEVWVCKWSPNITDYHCMVSDV